MIGKCDAAFFHLCFEDLLALLLFGHPFVAELPIAGEQRVQGLRIAKDSEALVARVVRQADHAVAAFP